MGPDGALTPKLSHPKSDCKSIPNLCLTTRPAIVALAARNRTSIVNHRNAALDRPAVTGIPQRVRDTQGYTPDFGRAVVAAWEHAVPHGRTSWGSMVLNEEIPMPMRRSPVFIDLCEDLVLRGLAASLQLPYDRSVW